MELNFQPFGTSKEKNIQRQPERDKESMQVNRGSEYTPSFNRGSKNSRFNEFNRGSVVNTIQNTGNDFKVQPVKYTPEVRRIIKWDNDEWQIKRHGNKTVNFQRLKLPPEQSEQD